MPIRRNIFSFFSQKGVILCNVRVVPRVEHFTRSRQEIDVRIVYWTCRKLVMSDSYHRYWLIQEWKFGAMKGIRWCGTGYLFLSEGGVREDDYAHPQKYFFVFFSENGVILCNQRGA